MNISERIFFLLSNQKYLKCLEEDNNLLLSLRTFYAFSTASTITYDGRDRGKGGAGPSFA